MLYLSTVAGTQGDPVALAMVLVLALIVAVMALRKHQSRKNAAQECAAPTVPAAVQPVPARKAPEAPGAAGKLKIHDVEPKTAAMIMAITADKLGKPLNELRFISIKEVK